jgi:hypothetical protein
MNNFLTKFPMPTSNISLVVTIKSQPKKSYLFYAVAVLLFLCILQKQKSLKEGCIGHFSKIFYHIRLQDLDLPASMSLPPHRFIRLPCFNYRLQEIK